jgi:hypothetical protein
MRPPKPDVEQAGSSGSGTVKSWLKRLKVRIERRRAKQNPESPPTYGKYRGYK